MLIEKRIRKQGDPSMTILSADKIAANNTTWQQKTHTGKLRWAVPPHTTTQAPVLQQEVRIDTINNEGVCVDSRCEWIDVPLVVVGG